MWANLSRLLLVDGKSVWVCPCCFELANKSPESTYEQLREQALQQAGLPKVEASPPTADSSEAPEMSQSTTPKAAVTSVATSSTAEQANGECAQLKHDEHQGIACSTSLPNLPTVNTALVQVRV